MSKDYPEVGDLVKHCGLRVITGFGQFRGGDGETTWGLLLDGETDCYGAEWGGWAGIAKTPKGYYKKKKGKNVSIQYHLVWNDKGYWEQTKGEGDCPVLELWQKNVRLKRGY